jgi:hypothetical protein
MKNWILISLMILLSFPAYGQEMRQWSPIRTKAAILHQLPPGATLVEPAKPLAAGTLSRTAEQISGTWNSPEFEKMLSDNFYDRSRLNDAMKTETAKDARLKVLNSHSASILNQAIVPDPQGGHLRVSNVSVILETRAEFNDPKNGFISAPGTNEMVMEVIEKID